jgi:DNA-binding CsgD family transcriptional regulator
MAIIRYWTGKKVIGVEVTEAVEKIYKESLREEWLSDKRAERYQTAISLCQMEDENGYQAAGLELYGSEDVMIKREERLKLRRKILKALSALTAVQRKLVGMLYKGMSGNEIARALGKDKSAVSHMKKRVQKIFSDILKREDE